MITIAKNLQDLEKYKNDIKNYQAVIAREKNRFKFYYPLKMSERRELFEKYSRAKQILNYELGNYKELRQELKGDEK